MRLQKDLSISIWIKYIPILSWGVVYLLTCVLAALLLIWEYRSFTLLFEYFSGVRLELPKDGRSLSVFWMLLLLAPLFLLGGYRAGWRLALTHGISGERNRLKKLDTEWIWALTTFGFSLLMAFWSLWRGGSFDEVFAWYHYESWIEARWRLFSRLGFFEFVNLYMFLPLSAGWLIITAGRGERLLRLMAGVAVVLVLVVAALLFQKKSVIVSGFLMISVWATWRLQIGRLFKHPRLLVGFAVTLFIAFYFFMVVLPVYHQTQEVTQETEESRRLNALLEEFGGFSNREEAIFFYSLLAPLTRTSVPAIYYSFVFPKDHPFYGLDLGQDVLGIGSMPDDNKVVWRRMNPDVAGGAVAAPFHFVLYSQMGVSGALAGSLIVGFVLGWLWFRVVARYMPPIIGALAGALIVLLAIYLAIDSLRNSLIVSYGIGWGVVFLLWVYLSEKIGAKIKAI